MHLMRRFVKYCKANVMVDARPVHKIGMSFGKKSGTINEWKEV